ncbi:unnamed protein product, partial [Aphanomyces euteiches]
EPYYALNKGRENEDGQYQVLSIDDRHVFPCCLRYSIKTPAQLLTEFQAKNKGVAVIYTNSIVVGALTNIRVIESVGPTSAEGFADKKKLAKQYAAQSLLVKLNPEVTTISSASMKTASSDR